MRSENDLNDQSLSPGPFTFTPERIEFILRENTFIRDPSSSDRGVPAPFRCSKFRFSEEDGILTEYTHRKHNLLVEAFCEHLCKLACDADSHVSRLDDALSTIATCQFQPKGPIPAILDGTLALLTRLPARPLELPDFPNLLHPAYLIPNACRAEDPVPLRWQTLQATARVSSNVIRSALLIFMDSDAVLALRELIDSIAELLEVASRLSLAAKAEPVKQQWFIVRAFLWSSWQRCIMIYFLAILKVNLFNGFNDDESDHLTLRGTVPSPRLSIQEMSKLYAGSKKSKYMCGWAFELLRGNPVCIGMDFRRFHERYSEGFQNNPSRCIANHSESSCKGDRPDSCQRFKGLFIENQSAHDSGCLKDCGRLTWDEESYRSIAGARAVSIDASTDFETKIKYCEASKETLAVSHVWSHGQGGRPEDPHGFNRCLHRRYISLAKSLGCTSYWMDTPCIPEDHELRAESISKINEVFQQSKVTLVCDRDLMEIEIKDLSIKIREQILVTVMVCDWNLRAWTFLEAFRGRHAIYLLCKDNAIVSLKETVEVVYHYGSIDVGLLLLTVPHLLPCRKYKNAIASQPLVNGYLTVEASGSLLSHRAASRPGDDIVIWSLLLEEQVFKDAESFWRSRIGKIIHTNFLLSSAPRLGVRGFGWAPSTPTAYLMADTSGESTSRLVSHTGTGSEVGDITRDGLVADWLKYTFVGPGIISKTKATIDRVDLSSDKLCRRNIRRIRKTFVQGYRWGCLLQPVSDKHFGMPAANPVDASKILVVVCVMNHKSPFKRSVKDDKILWEWKGVYEWDLTEPLPEFELITDNHIVIV